MQPADPRTAPSPEPQRPDVVIQVSEDAGIVAEAKISASSARDFADAELQVRRYDTDLIGWCTENERIAAHDLLLLVHYTHAPDAGAHFSHVEYARPFVLVSMTRNDQRDSFISFEARHGALSDDRLQGKLKRIATISLERLAPRLAAKFCDAKPECVEYTMDVLWREHIAKVGDATAQRSVTKGNRRVPQRRVQVRGARQWLEDRFALLPMPRTPATSRRQPSIPDASWIAEAMDMFVGLGRAEPDPEEHGAYWVTYSPRARNANLAGFARQVYRRKLRKKGPPRPSAAPPGQPSLFPDND